MWGWSTAVGFQTLRWAADEFCLRWDSPVFPFLMGGQGARKRTCRPKMRAQSSSTCRVVTDRACARLHTYLASLGAAEAVFEQDAPDLAMLETQITRLTASSEFQAWSKRMLALLAQSPKREIYIVAQ